MASYVYGMDFFGRLHSSHFYHSSIRGSWARLRRDFKARDDGPFDLEADIADELADLGWMAVNNMTDRWETCE